MNTTQQPWQDTPEQARTLRTSKVARKVRRMYPQGQRVAVTGGTDKVMPGQPVRERVVGYGTVYRHVPGSNAQGGHVVVDLDNGVRARLGPFTLRPVRDGEADR